MCGICGYTGVVAAPGVLREMTRVITHRGPDSEGFFSDDQISMGFRRLSIIDLEKGSQPIYNEDKSLVLTFNGEIYNYRELKALLLEKGHVFATDTDSEVLVHGFEEWGVELLNNLRGMFGFAIYNVKDGSVFLARDFFGIKPMHYMTVDGHFVYGSEIKSLLKFPGYEKKFNLRALDKYLSFQYSVPPETFFEGISCLLPGHYLWYKNGEITIKRYFEPTFQPDNQLSLDQAVDKISKVFAESVDAHKISDVEVGCFLSSGVDSSYVSTYFPGQKAFTVGFDFGEKYNEISWARNLSDIVGINHYAKVITSEEFWQNVPRVQYFMDQPLADPSCIALYFVSRLASEHVKVVLSGEGADEFFGGYNIYQESGLMKFYQAVLPGAFRRWLAKKVRHRDKFKGQGFLLRGANKTEDKFIGNAYMFDEEDKRELMKHKDAVTRAQDYCKPYYDRVKDYDRETKMQYLDINLWMVGDILLKADRMSMANSLELRVPFLDKEVFRVASALPTKYRVNKQATKYAMRKAAGQRMPDTTSQKKKLGFPVPTRVWLKDELYYRKVKEMFQSKTAKQFFETDVLIRFLDEHYQGKRDNSRKVWTVYVFLVWYEIYFNEKAPEEVAGIDIAGDAELHRNRA